MSDFRTLSFNPEVDLFDPRTNEWLEVRVHDLYNNTNGGDQNSPVQNQKVGALYNIDNVFAKVIAAYTSPSAGANQSIWLGESAFNNNVGGDDAFFSPAGGVLGHPLVIESTMYIGVNGVNSATRINGIAMGRNQAAQATLQASPTNSLIALYAAWNDATWHLRLAPGGGVAAADVVLAGVGTPAVGMGNHIKILYDPILKTLQGKIDGVLSPTMITDSTKFPTPTGVTFTGFNGFGQTGTNAGGIDSFAFYNCRYWVKMG